MNEKEIGTEKDEKESGTEKKEKSTMSVKARQVSAGFIFLMGLFLIFSHGYVAGILFIMSAYIAYEPKSSGRDNFITSLSGFKRLAAVFLLLAVAVVFLPNDNSNSPSASASTQPTTTSIFKETPAYTGTSSPNITPTPITASDATSTMNVTDYQDNQWRETCLEDLSIVDEEMKACSYAATNSDFASLSSNANSLFIDSKKAMGDSNLYSVSPELQNVKDEYILLMEQANLAAEWSIKSVNAYNSGNTAALQQDMETATQSMEDYTQHLNELIELLSAYDEKLDNQSTSN